MTMASLGQLTIEVTPQSSNPKILNVVIGCENRKEVVSNETRMDETVDQFSGRIRSMLRGLMNAEPRIPEEEKVNTPKKQKTWPEQKAEIKNHAT